MAPKKAPKRLGKKHRQASTRPHKGKAPKATPTTGAVDPRKRKVIASKQAKATAEKRVSRRSPEFEAKRSITGDDAEKPLLKPLPQRTAPGRSYRSDSQQQAAQEREGKGSGGARRRITTTKPDSPEAAWREAELLALQQSVTLGHQVSKALPLIAICGRPNVGKSTLFNRLTGSRRSIVGDEPGITRDRIYGEIEWAGRDVRLVDTGGVVPDDEALIPSEIFRQAQVALEEADAIVMVVDGRTELASPDMELARLLIRGGKPVFLAVNKIDAPEMHTAAENFRRLGFRNVVMISAEHGSGIGDLLDDVFAVLPEAVPEEEPTPEEEAEAFEDEFEPLEEGAEEKPRRRQRTHGEYESRETKVAIIGRPNVGKSTLLNALTGTDRAIVSDIAGTTRDAVDEIVERKGHLLPLRRYRRHPPQGQDQNDGRKALRHHGAQAPGSGRRFAAADRRDRRRDQHRRQHRRLRARGRPVGHHRDQQVGPDDHARRTDGKPPADQKVYAQQVRDALKYLDYAPLLFISAGPLEGDPRAIGEVFKPRSSSSRASAASASPPGR